MFVTIDKFVTYVILYIHLIFINLLTASEEYDHDCAFLLLSDIDNILEMPFIWPVSVGLFIVLMLMILLPCEHAVFVDVGLRVFLEILVLPFFVIT